MSFVSENGGILGVVAAAAIGVGGYAELRIRALVPEKVATEVNAKLEAVHSVSPDKIQSMEGDIADNKDYIRKTEDKVERIVDILLEE